MKKYKINLTVITSIIVSIILFLLFNKEHFALDTYGFELDINNNISWYFSNGRIFMSLYLKICSILNISFKNIKFVSLILSLVSLFISNIILSKNIDKYINKKYSHLISTSIIYSPFIFEFFLFPEYTGIMSFAILMSVLSYIFITKYFDLKKLKYLILSILFAFISVSSYQGVIGCFVALSAFYIIANYKNIKEFIKQNIFVISIYGVVSLISLIITKVSGLARVSTTGYNLIKTIQNVFLGTIRLLINTSYVFPKYYFGIVIFLITVLIIIRLIKSNNKKNILLTLYLIAVVILFSVAPQFLVRYDTVWIVARSNIPMSMIFGLLCLVYVYFNKNNDKYTYIVLVVCAFTILLQLFGWYNIRNDHYLVNRANEKEAETIINEIKNYELENKTNITNIALAYDSSLRYTVDGVKTTSGDVNVRAFVFEWSIQDILNYYSNKTYKFIEPLDEFATYCSNNNWDNLDKKQFRFSNDTLYICIY